VKETQLIRQAAEEVLQMDSQQQDAFAAMTKTADATLFVAVTEEVCASVLQILFERVKV
jgi:hypothetical protein